MCMGCASMIWVSNGRFHFRQRDIVGIPTTSFSIFWLNGTHFGVHRTAVMFFCSHFTEPPHNSLFMYDNCKRTHHRWPLSTAHSHTELLFAAQATPIRMELYIIFCCFRRDRDGIESGPLLGANLCGPDRGKYAPGRIVGSVCDGVFATQHNTIHRAHSAR